MSNIGFRIAAVLLSVTVISGAMVGIAPPVAAQAAPGIGLIPPTSAEIIDPFRPPAGTYSPGNRGLEYGTTAGDRISAAAAGVVAFAGPVGGSLFVSVDHGGGYRTTYGFVDRITTRVGRRIQVGTLVARAGGSFHFSLRHEGRYLDPAVHFGRFSVSVRLVPVSTSLSSRDSPISGYRWLRHIGQIPSQPAARTETTSTLVDGPFGPRMPPYR
jgi:murein DD-endopeptidase MepM/ murein hydrolase activator NlpD